MTVWRPLHIWCFTSVLDVTLTTLWFEFSVSVCKERACFIVPTGALRKTFRNTFARVWIWVKRAINRSPAETIRTALIRLARNNQRNFIYGSTAIKTFACDYLLMQFKSSAVSRNEPRWGLVKKSSLPLIRDRAALLRKRERERDTLPASCCLRGLLRFTAPMGRKGERGNKTTRRQMNMVRTNDRKEKTVERKSKRSTW